MKLCNFIVDGKIHVAAKCERGVIDVTAAGLTSTMNSIIENSCMALELIASFCVDRSLPVLMEEDMEFAPVTEPSKIVCVGLNYKKHAEETGGTPPEHPLIFGKFNDALCAAGTEVKLPEWQRCYDYEAELVIVIGKPAWNVLKEDALNCIFGYTCGNDLSARDCQFVSSQWLIGKSFPCFAPAGPFIVTADSFDPDEPHSITCELNGTPVQADETNGMIFSCAEIVSYASHYFSLKPGDLIFTGTPSGVILGHEKGKRVWMKPGDEVKVTIDGIGTLKNVLK